MSIVVPIPSTFEQAVWLAMGVTFGRAFGKKLDWDVINTEWFKSLSPIMQNVVSRLLDCTHHWWIGALLMLYSPAMFGVILYWFGAGLLLDDLPDIPQRFIKINNAYLETEQEGKTSVITTTTPSVVITTTPTPTDPVTSTSS
jgi:hypothetical protein